MDELKPCPFCGGKPTLMFNSVVECRHCPTVKYSGYPSADITAWNTRAASGGDSASLEQRARDVVVTDTMVDAYLAAQAKAVQEVDDKWGNGGKAASYLHPVREACRAGLTAALANQQGVEMSSGQIAALARLASGDRESNPDDQTKWIVRQLLTGHAGYELYAHMTDYPEEGTFLLEAYAGDKK